jgi:hypothetical protein
VVPPAAVTITDDDKLGATLQLADRLVAGTTVDATIGLALAELQPQDQRWIKAVALTATGVTTDVDRFDDDETHPRPRTRVVLIQPLAVAVTAGASGPATLAATVALSDGTSRSLRWTLAVADADPTACPPPAPGSLPVEVSAEGHGAPVVQLVHRGPPRVGVTSMLHVELAVPAELGPDSPEGAFSFSYMTWLQPGDVPDLGLAPVARPGGKKGVAARWIGESRIAFDVPITPTRAGEIEASATFQPYYCGVQSCHVDPKHTLRWTVTVAPE